MKTLNLEALGLQEMSKEEMINNKGGYFNLDGKINDLKDSLTVGESRELDGGLCFGGGFIDDIDNFSTCSLSGDSKTLPEVTIIGKKKTNASGGDSTNQVWSDKNFNLIGNMGFWGIDQDTSKSKK